MFICAVPETPHVSGKMQAETQAEATVGEVDDGVDKSVVKLTKAEKHAKLKKLRKEAKRQAKVVPEVEEMHQTPQVDVLVYLLKLPVCLLIIELLARVTIIKY